MTRDEMAETLQRIVTATRRWNELAELEEVEVVAGAGAAPRALEALEQATEIRLPPSYRMLLGLHDGIRGCYRLDGDLLPSSYRFEYDSQFASCVEAFQLPRLLFFAIDNDGSAAAFCTDAADPHGEMQVIEIVNYREVSRHASLVHFLEFYRDLLEGWVRAEEHPG